MEHTKIPVLTLDELIHTLEKYTREIKYSINISYESAYQRDDNMMDKYYIDPDDINILLEIRERTKLLTRNLKEKRPVTTMIYTEYELYQ